MRNLTVALCVSAILAGCGGGGESPPTSNKTVASTTVTIPVAVVNPLKIITGTSYDAKDQGFDPRFVKGDFNNDGVEDILLRYNPASAFSTTKTGTSPIRFFLGSSNGGFEQSTSIFPKGLELTLVTRIIATDLNGDGQKDIFIASAGQDPYENGVYVMNGHPGDKSQILTYTPNGYVLSSVPDMPLAFAHHASTADIDGDYLSDVLVTSMMYQKIYFVKGNSNSNYKITTKNFSYNGNPTVLETFPNGQPKKWQSPTFTSSALVDANNDGSMDVVLLPSEGSKIGKIFFNDGSGNFSEDRSVDLPVGPYGEGYEFKTDPSSDRTYISGSIFLDSIVADINGDGKNDIIALATKSEQTESSFGYYQNAAIQILINNGNGFTDESAKRSNFKHVTNTNFTHYDSIEYSDINNDGYKDILLHRAQNVNDGYNPTRILVNDGKGNFSEVQYPVNVPKGILTVIGKGHYAVLVSTGTNNVYTQRIDDVYFDWSKGVDFFTGK